MSPFDFVALPDLQLPKFLWWIVMGGLFLLVADQYLPWLQRVLYVLLLWNSYYWKRKAQWPIGISVRKAQVVKEESSGAISLDVEFKLTPRLRSRLLQACWLDQTDRDGSLHKQQQREIDESALYSYVAKGRILERPELFKARFPIIGVQDDLWQRQPSLVVISEGEYCQARIVLNENESN
ncbi:hypothetical protein ACFLWY_05300 [Chloroflexota bacterium]